MKRTAPPDLLAILIGGPCRYCEQPVTERATASITHGYWGGSPFICHKACKYAGVRQEAFDCQVIDADCNDCIHFQRGKLVERWLSTMEDGKAAMKLVNMGLIEGTCLKFNKPTHAQPNKWTGHECFQHRRQK